GRQEGRAWSEGQSGGGSASSAKRTGTPSSTGKRTRHCRQTSACWSRSSPAERAGSIGQRRAYSNSSVMGGGCGKRKTPPGCPGGVISLQAGSVYVLRSGGDMIGIQVLVDPEALE